MVGFMLVARMSDGTAHRVALEDRHWALFQKWLRGTFPRGVPIDKRRMAIIALHDEQAATGEKDAKVERPSAEPSGATEPAPAQNPEPASVVTQATIPAEIHGGAY